MLIPLFDIDGTLIRGGIPSHRDGFDRCFRNIFGTPDALSMRFSPHGMTDRQIVVEAMAAHGWSRDAVLERWAEAEEVIRSHCLQHLTGEECVLLPGVPETLKVLHAAGVSCGLLTGNIEAIAWRKMDLIGLRRYFAFGAFGCASDCRSDLIGIARARAAEVLGREVLREELIIVGDSPRDIECARNGGIKVISVATGSYSVNDLSAADVVLPNLADGAAVLRALSGP